MPAMADPYATLAGLLFDAADPAAARRAIDDDALSDIRARLDGMPHMSFTAASGALAEQLNAALNVTPSDVLKRAWAKLKALDDALNGPPGETAVVAIADHKVKSVHHPKIEILAGDAVIATIVLDAEFVFSLEGINLKVGNGRILEIIAGSLTVSASLKYKGTELVRKQTPKFEAGRLLLFDDENAIQELPPAVEVPPGAEPQAVHRATRRGMSVAGAWFIGLLLTVIAGAGVWYVAIEERLAPEFAFGLYAALSVLAFVLLVPSRYAAKRKRENTYMRTLTTTFALVLVVFWLAIPMAEDRRFFDKDPDEIFGLILTGPARVDDLATAFRVLAVCWPAFLGLALVSVVYCGLLNRSLRKATEGL